MIEDRRNILVLSHVYPGAGVPDTFTPVVHYFTREWVKMGYNVRVVSIWNYFPRFYYWAPNWVREIAIKKFGCALPEKQLPQDIVYELDDVKVFRYTIMKYFPASCISEERLDGIVHKIKDMLVNEKFSPDYIISHWSTPQIYLSYKLRGLFPNAKTTVVLHEDGSRIKDYANWQKMMSSIDVWGYRSKAIKMSFEKQFGCKDRSFWCCSGIPSTYLGNNIKRNWGKRNRFVYVGYLLRRKYADVAVRAVSRVCKGEDFEFHIIGNGEMYSELLNIVDKQKLHGHVYLLGRLKRNEILAYLDNSDIFIMISRNEVFGLVYLEAMARGCLVIASRGEGMQGIIEDGYNGFMCEAGNQDELMEILQRIKSMPIEQIGRISSNAIATAAQYTDVAVARQYINNVERL